MGDGSSVSSILIVLILCDSLPTEGFLSLPAFDNPNAGALIG